MMVFPSSSTLTYVVETTSEINLVIKKTWYLYVKNRINVFSPLLFQNPKLKTNEAIILPIVLYKCETWSRTQREDHRLRVFENSFLRRIFGPKREKVTE
jgi:hypothetical protein